MSSSCGDFFGVFLWVKKRLYLCQVRLIFSGKTHVCLKSVGVLFRCGGQLRILWYSKIVEWAKLISAHNCASPGAMHLMTFIIPLVITGIHLYIVLNLECQLPQSSTASSHGNVLVYMHVIYPSLHGSHGT